MSDRRAEAYDALEVWEHDALNGQHSRSVVDLLTALRSVLERHQSIRPDLEVAWCQHCGMLPPCPDETAVIDAVLGPVE